MHCPTHHPSFATSITNSAPHINAQQQVIKVSHQKTFTSHRPVEALAIISGVDTANQSVVHELSPSTIASTFTPSRETETSDVSHVSASPVEIKLFVGKVPKTVGDEPLRAVFSEFGLVRDVVIIRDRDLGAHKGCAFIRMASITQADFAIRQLNNIRVLDSKVGPLQVKYAFGEPERLGLLLGNSQPGVDQAKLFVGSLPKSATEEELHAVFSRFGAIDEVFVMRDEDKISKGCAFVRFAFKEEAFSAIANLNKNYTIAGGSRPMDVRFAEAKKFDQQPNPYGSLTSSFVPGLRQPSTSSKWLEYTSSSGRPYYYYVPTGHTQWERPAELGPLLAAPQTHPNVVPGGIGGHTHGPPGANVFIFHIPNDWREHELVTKFSPFGQIVSARIATEKGTGRRLGFGFVSFSEIEAAVQAVISLNSYPVSGKRLKVTIKRGEEQYTEPYLPADLNHSHNKDMVQRPKIPQPTMSLGMSNNLSMSSDNASNEALGSHLGSHMNSTSHVGSHMGSLGYYDSQAQLPFPRRSTQQQQQQQPQYQFTSHHKNSIEIPSEHHHSLSTIVQQQANQQHHSSAAQYYPPNIQNYLTQQHNHDSSTAQSNFNFLSAHLYSALHPSSIPSIATIIQ